MNIKGYKEIFKTDKKKKDSLPKKLLDENV